MIILSLWLQLSIYGPEGIANWCVTLIDQAEDKNELRKKELYWINKLNIWAPIGLNVREVYKAY